MSEEKPATPGQETRAVLEAELLHIVGQRCRLAHEPCSFCARDVAALMVIADAYAAAAQQQSASGANAGTGWYEVIHPVAATTLLAYVHEDGSVYFPETSDGQAEFEFAAARGNVHRLIRASEAQPAPDLAARLERAQATLRETAADNIALREQVRLARADRDAVRGRMLALAAKFEAEAETTDGGYTDGLRWCAGQLRKALDPN
jgi:hypothetical protein